MTPQAWTTLAIGLVGFGGVILTMRQRDRSDRQSAWWERATWAFEQTLRDDLDAQATGFYVLDALRSSKLVPVQDREFLTALTARRLAGEIGLDLREADDPVDNGEDLSEEQDSERS